MNRPLLLATLPIALLAVLASLLLRGGGDAAELRPAFAGPNASRSSGSLASPSPAREAEPPDEFVEPTRTALAVDGSDSSATEVPTNRVRLVPLDHELDSVRLSWSSPGANHFRRATWVRAHGGVEPWPRGPRRAAEVSASTRAGTWRITFEPKVAELEDGVYTLRYRAERCGVARIRLFAAASPSPLPLGEGDDPLPLGGVVRLARADGYGAERVVRAGEPIFRELSPGVYEVRARTARHHEEAALLRVEPGVFADLDLRLRARDDLVDLRVVLRAEGGRDTLLPKLEVEFEGGSRLVWNEGRVGITRTEDSFTVESPFSRFPPVPRDLAGGIELVASDVLPGPPTIRLDTDARYEVELRRGSDGSWVAEIEWDESGAVEGYGTWSATHSGDHDSPEEAWDDALMRRDLRSGLACFDY